MKIEETKISDVKVLESTIFEDERGYFFEAYNQREFGKLIGSECIFVQDNFSNSKRGVLRGLHYQVAPKSQGKLVRCVRGEIFDVAIDLRQNSQTFGQWVGEVLSNDNKKQLWIPEGFAHGFLTLSETAEVMYKTTDFYDQDCERCIMWNDPDINIDWPIESEPLLSTKDKQAGCFRDLKAG